MTTNEPTSCPKCGCTECRAIEATDSVGVDVYCIRCGTLYKSAKVTSGGGTKSEPTTGEFNIDYSQVTNDALVCGLRLIMSISPKWSVAVSPVIDRIQLQEITIMEKDAEIERLKGDRRVIIRAVTETNMCAGDLIERLTARAEQAEKERDAVVKSVDRLIEAWENFKSPALIEFLKQWRGLPQEGEQNNGQANNDHLR